MTYLWLFIWGGWIKCNAHIGVIIFCSYCSFCCIMMMSEQLTIKSNRINHKSLTQKNVKQIRFQFKNVNNVNKKKLKYVNIPSMNIFELWYFDITSFLVFNGTYWTPMFNSKHLMQLWKVLHKLLCLFKLLQQGCHFSSSYTMHFVGWAPAPMQNANDAQQHVES